MSLRQRLLANSMESNANQVVMKELMCYKDLAGYRRRTDLSEQWDEIKPGTTFRLNIWDEIFS